VLGSCVLTRGLYFPEGKDARGWNCEGGWGPRVSRLGALRDLMWEVVEMGLSCGWGSGYSRG